MSDGRLGVSERSALLFTVVHHTQHALPSEETVNIAGMGLVRTPTTLVG